MTTVQNQGNNQFQTVLPQTTQSQPAQAVYATNPQQQTTAPTGYAGVNIQIYNPSVGIPNLNPTGNMPVYQGLPGMAYPSNYYTQQFVPPGGITAQGGNAVVNNTIQSPQNGVASQPAAQLTPSDNTTSANTETKQSTETKTTEGSDKKKTEKRKIVELTDEYIKNLENYLNSQDKEVRMMGAKEVVARLQEDDSRKDDPALTALINKMLQDPSQQIRFLALSMLDSRICTGNDYTVGVLKKMQTSTSGYGQDAAQAGLLGSQAHSLDVRKMKGLKIPLGKTDAPQLMVSHFFKAEIPERGYPICKENPTGFLRNLNGAIVVGIALHQGNKTIGWQRFNPMVSKIQVGGLGAVGNSVNSLQQKLFV